MRSSPLFVLVVIIVAMMVTAGSALFAYRGVRQFTLDSPIELPAPPQVNAQPRPTATSVPTLVSTASGASQPTSSGPVPTVAAVSNPAQGAVTGWTDPKRFTILLLGIDQRKGEAGPFRTDTMIVLSLDPVRKSAAMISIPRDIYLEIPFVKKYDRINNANVWGDTTAFPNGGGPKLAAKTVESLLGITIDRYVEVNFAAFNKILDTIGPINVCPDTAIHDDHYPAYDSYAFITVDFQAGCQDVDATRALEYARVRHNAGDDMGRAQRQQEVIKAVKKKALSLGGVTKLIGQALPLWNEIKDDIRTDLTFDEITQLAQTGQDINNIQSTVLTIKQQGNNGQLLTSTIKETGEQVLVPIYSDVHDVVVNLFDASRAGPAGANPLTQNVTLIVSNGAGVDGLGKATTDKLTAAGFHMIPARNSDSPGSYAKTEIRVYNKDKMATAQYIAQVLGLKGPSLVQDKNGPAGVDIEIVAGKDLVPKQ